MLIIIKGKDGDGSTVVSSAYCKYFIFDAADKLVAAYGEDGKLLNTWNNIDEVIPEFF